MIELRWLNRNWEELTESGYRTKSERVLQYSVKIPQPTVDICDAGWSEWKDVEEVIELIGEETSN